MYNKFRGLSAILVLMFSFSIQAQIVINEVDADTAGSDELEFVELFGPPNTALDGMVLVFFNGNNSDQSYRAIDLDGETLNANGFFVAGNTLVANVDLIFPNNGLQNGFDAVALYTGNDTDFPNNTAATATNIIDALVYDTSDPDDVGLIATLTPGQSQINEDGGIDKDIESNSRFPDGGTALVTSTYTQQTPTPGTFNAPRISIDDVSQVEGDVGTTTFDFTVSIDVTAAATVQVDTADSTATTGDSDYVAQAAQTVTFTDGGALTQTFSVTVNGDTTVEANEVFFVNLTNAVGASIADTQGEGTITNDDVVPVVASAVVNTQVLINGDSTGQATASGAGGTGPYTYLWDDGAAQTTAIATGLAAGTYTVTVTDSTGTNNDTAMVTITEPTVLTSTATVTDETSVGANDGTATVVAAGGVGPYTYIWSPGGATTATITGLAPGSYTVVVMDANGATSSPVAPSVIAAALPPAIIPTLNQYMIMLLMLLVGLVAFRKVRVKA